MTLGTPVTLPRPRPMRAVAPALLALISAFAPTAAAAPARATDPASAPMASGLPVAPVAAPRAPGEDPPSTVSLTLPQTALELHLDYRQLGPDLSRFQEPEGVDSLGLHQLQVGSLLAQGGKLKSGVSLRVGGHVFKPANYPMGFTVALGGAMRFFLVDGTDAVPLPSTDVTPGWATERLVMNLEYADRTNVRLMWHLGTKAGRIDLGLGSSVPDGTSAPPAPPAPTTPSSAPEKPAAPGGAGLPVKPTTPPVVPGSSGGSSPTPPVEPPAAPPKSGIALATPSAGAVPAPSATPGKPATSAQDRVPRGG